MKTTAKIIRLPFLVILACIFSSCSNDDDNNMVTEDAMTIAEIASETDDLSSLVAALERANLVSVLNGNDEFTVFAPTNAAFEAFLNGTPLENVPVADLQQILLNHVIAGKNVASSLTTGYFNSESTAGVNGNKLSLYINTVSGVEINGISSVIENGADIEASNGIIHIVDAVIGLPNIVDFATTNDALTNLVAALTDEGSTVFTDLLASEGPFTVFAPSNDAFISFLNGIDLNAVDNALLANLLANHVITGAGLLSTDLSNGYTNTAAVNSDNDFLSLYVNIDEGVVLNGSSTVIIADIVATNGIIHVIDAVIDLPSVVTFAGADPTFDSLVEALTRGDQPDFVSVLSGTTDAPFTVFAPVNDAFQALLDSNNDWNSLADIDGTLLTSVLQHHVIANANIRAEDLSDGLTSPATLEGDALLFNIGTDVTITDGAGNTGIRVIATNVQATNGVIHAVDTVLIPDTMN
ncbi:fasciclin domain-containing protein [Leptobacterium sp. I13]|uniref:fasciclin domain-containing protein n=1 Tax=Leptobacterium meishanense TaxID=3128904 RepID=UPI0030EB371C